LREIRKNKIYKKNADSKKMQTLHAQQSSLSNATFVAFAEVNDDWIARLLCGQ